MKRNECGIWFILYVKCIGRKGAHNSSLNIIPYPHSDVYDVAVNIWTSGTMLGIRDNKQSCFRRNNTCTE